MMKKILLVGAQGLVGSHFVNLYTQQYHIICANKNDDPAAYPDEIDALVFLAQSKDYNLTEFTEHLFNTNVALVRRYLQQFSGKCPKIILFSTGSVYQDSHDEIFEDSALIQHNPTPYVASKLMAEMLTKTYAKIYPSIAIVRPFCIYGKGQRPTMLFSRLFNSFKNTTPIEIGQHHGILFNPIHATDAARFIDYLIHKNFMGVEYFNLFGPQVLTLMDVIQKMSALLEITPTLTIREWPFKKVVANTLQPGFYPTFDLEKGLLNTLDLARVY